MDPKAYSIAYALLSPMNAAAARSRRAAAAAAWVTAAVLCGPIPMQTAAEAVGVSPAAIRKWTKRILRHADVEYRESETGEVLFSLREWKTNEKTKYLGRIPPPCDYGVIEAIAHASGRVAVYVKAYTNLASR